MRILKNTLLAGLMLLFSCMKGEAQSGAKNTFSEFPKYTVFFISIIIKIIGGDY
jgi:hypothetical protein|nr:hypothetical protein [Bacteroides acidifaciens]